MKKNVLLSTLGGSPKTVTEMYQALKFEGVSIQEIHLVGTQGSTSVPEEFRDPKTPGTTWHEVRSQASDVRSREDALEVSDLLFRTLKTLKERSDVERIFLDLTGGRKEMSSYLMASAQLLCSEDDRLYHVEVNDRASPLMDSKNKTYYYPQRKEEITLIEVPFVRLRNLFQVVGITQESSLQSFLEKSRESLRKLCFCGLMGNGIGHETAPLLMDAANNAPQITDTLRQIEGIFQQFHAVLRREKVVLRAIPLASILKKTKEMMKRRISASVDIGHAPDVRVQGDEVLLLRVLCIVLKNADKHGDADRIEIAVSEHGNEVALRISDNGKGMPGHVREEAFCPFKSYHTGVDGRQVGLPVARELMEVCQGSIEIEKSDSSGTMIVLRLKKSEGA